MVTGDVSLDTRESLYLTWYRVAAKENRKREDSERKERKLEKKELEEEQNVF